MKNSRLLVCAAIISLCLWLPNAFAAKPTFTLQPSNIGVEAGSPATFNVEVTGSPTFQWQQSNNGGSTFSNMVDGTLPSGAIVSGVTTDFLNIANIQVSQIATKYQVIATNADGSTTSKVASLIGTFTVDASIRTQPVPATQTVAAGAMATFTVVTDGGPRPAFQWRRGTTVLTEGLQASGSTIAFSTSYNDTMGVNQTSGIMTITNAMAGDAGTDYNVVVSNTTETGAHSQTSKNVILKVSTGGKLAQTITFAGPSNQAYRTTPITLSATASSSLAVSFSVVTGPAAVANNQLTLTGVGSVTVRASQAGNTNYTAAPSVDRTFTVSKAAAVITWATPSAIGYGVALGTAQLNATADIVGTVTYSPAAGAILDSGNQTLSATFTPTDTTKYAASTVQRSLSVTPAVATVTLANLSAAYNGSAHAAKITTAPAALLFNVTYNGGASVPVAAGSYAVVATVSDTNYAGSAKGTLTITKATPVLSWASPAAINVGTGLSSTQLNATAPVAGSFVYTPAVGTVLPQGTQSLSATFAPVDSVNYNPATAAVTVLVQAATAVPKISPSITWSVPSSVGYGVALSGTQLNATADVPGSFLYTPAAGTVLNSGTQVLSVTFTPTDTAKYNSATLQRSLTITPTAATVTLGSLSASYNGAAHAAKVTTTPAALSVEVTYNGGATSPMAAGKYSVVATVSDPNYSGSVTGTLTIAKATPTVNWATPAAMTAGSALGNAQLNAKASVAGAFTYTPAAGTVVAEGTQTLNAAFTPSDLANYNSSTASVTVVVQTAGAAPVFTINPTSQSAAQGLGVTLNCLATGATAYQWQKNSTNISGATGTSYAIANLATNDAGTYRVIATNAVGSTTSTSAVLTVVNKASAGSASPLDFDGDGQSDLIWQNTLTGERSFWLMNGTNLKLGVSLGMFAPDWTIVAAGDFNHDGKADLVWQNTITGERSIWLMNGTALALGVDLGTYSTDVMITATGDFNGDGQTDIVVQNISTGERSIWLMNGTAIVSEVSLGTVPTVWSIAGAADFDADGKVDLLWQNAATGERSVWLMNGTVPSSIVSLGIVPKQLQIVGTGDYNHDGQTDLVWTDTETGDRSIWMMNGTTHTSTASLANISFVWSLGRPIFLTAQTAHADFNGDGQTDVIWQNSATGERSISLMNGSTVLSTVSLGIFPANWVISGTGDFNHDEKPDLVWTNTTTGERTVWLMDGTTMTANVPLATIPPSWVISAIGDFNYDGKPDLVWTNTATGDRAIWLMDGTVFGSGIALGTIPAAWSIATAADLNGDGKTDLVWQNTSTGECSVWLMNGGTFTAGVALDTLPPQWSIVGCGDFNGDGKADLILENTATGEKAIRQMNRVAFDSTVSLGTFDRHWAVGN